MKSEAIQPLNYSTHAIEDLRIQARELGPVAPHSAWALERLANILVESVKFILPNCCALIDPEDLRQAHLDLLRPPHRCVAFEAPWDMEDEIGHVGEFEQMRATRRIALCWEHEPDVDRFPGLEVMVEAYPEGGLFVIPIYWAPEAKRWMVTLGGVFVPYDNVLRQTSLGDGTALPASRIAHAAALEAGLAKEVGNQFRCEPFSLLPELFERTVAHYGGDRSKALAQILLDARDEVQMVVQVCSVLNCANVAMADVMASPALNKKREAKGKPPFFSYKVLELKEERRSPAGAGSAGTHAAPRMHLRRGHVRRLEHKSIWIRPAMVNAGSPAGAVAKDYALRGDGR